MKRAMLILFCLIALALTGCSNVQDITASADTAMTVLLTGSGDPSECLADTAGEPISGISNDPTVQLFMENITYQVLSVEASGNAATVQIEITAPDGLDVITQAVEGMEELDEAQMFANIASILDKEQYDTLTFSVETEMKQIDRNWYLICNRELVNALSGGLYEIQFAQNQAVKDALLGE